MGAGGMASASLLSGPLCGQQMIHREVGERLQDIGPYGPRQAISVLHHPDRASLVGDGGGERGGATLVLDNFGSGLGHGATLPLVTPVRKHNITPGYAPCRSLGGVDTNAETDWARLKEPWERLAWARARDARYPTKRAFAETVGLTEHGYAAYERPPGSSKHTPLKMEQAVEWGKRLKVRWEWLFHGTGLPWLGDSDRDYTPAQKRAVELLHDKPAEQQARIVEALELLLRTGT